MQGKCASLAKFEPNLAASLGNYGESAAPQQWQQRHGQSRGQKKNVFAGRYTRRGNLRKIGGCGSETEGGVGKKKGGRGEQGRGGGGRQGHGSKFHRRQHSIGNSGCSPRRHLIPDNLLPRLSSRTNKARVDLGMTSCFMVVLL